MFCKIDKEKRLGILRQNFVQKGVLSYESIRPLIAKSWKRCYGVDPDADPFLANSSLKLSDEEYRLRRTRNQDLISITFPIMQDICFVSGQNYMVIADHDGYIIDAESNVDYPMPLGVKCTEDSIGTNALGTALAEGCPIEIKGHEHYASSMLSFHCFAMPIRDPDGGIIGVLNITNPYEDLPPNTTQMLKMGVRIIENQLKWQVERYRHNETRKIFDLIGDSIEHCMMVCEWDGRITEINQKCVNLLSYGDKEKILGLHFQELLKNNNGHFNNGFFNSQKFDLITKAGHITCRIVRVVKDPNISSKMLLLFEPVSTALSGESFFVFSNVLGKDKNWLKSLGRAKKAASYNSNVLIEGESGTGKEMIAQSIHSESGCKGLFVPINCGAIPKDLIESELFGYEEGAFTGARKGGMKGKFETAEGGTLFLDEIGEMPQQMQVRLLRFLQDKKLVRVGGTKPKQVNTRIIAATNRDLRKEVQEGRFREDLYYRLNVVNIYLPSLKDRPEDIPLLVRYFIENYCHEFKKEPVDIDKSAMGVLCRYNWPGNVRELSNVIENSIVFSEGGIILSEDLPPHISGYIPLKIEGKGALSDYEKIIILDALELYGGNISKVASTLGIARNTLYRKIKKFDISMKSRGLFERQRNTY